MQDYQRGFIEFALKLGVLQFGEFMLKSGRKSPYFFNSGLFNSGASLAQLGRAYAQAIVNWGGAFDMLFGPAYKGIPLVSAVSIALADRHDRDVPYAFNRKEAKQHGEGGITVGAPLQGRVLLIDDVISAGTSVRESVQIISAAQAQLVGVMIALDRQERGQGLTSAIQEVEHSLKIKVGSIIKLEHLVEYLEQQPNKDDALKKIREYQAQYGV